MGGKKYSKILQLKIVGIIMGLGNLLMMFKKHERYQTFLDYA